MSETRYGCTGCPDGCGECMEPMSRSLSTLGVMEAAENA